MAVTYYRYDDASAPTLTGQVGSFVALLDAVLVNGYGSKSAAGWTKPYTGTNKAVFRMATGAGKNGHYLRVLDDGTVTDGAARTAACLGFTAMTTVDAGTGQFPAASGQLAPGFVGIECVKSDTLDAVARPWFIIADDTYFMFYCWHTKTTFINDTPAARQTTFQFGQCDSRVTGDTGLTIINGKNNSTYTDVSAHAEAQRANAGIPFVANPRMFVAKDMFGFGVSIPVTMMNLGYCSSPTICIGLGPFPNSISGDISYTPTAILEKDPYGAYGILRGFVPYYFSFGEAVPDVTSLTASLARMFDTFEGQGADAGKTFMIVPCYQTSTPYATVVQISGNR